MLLTSLYSMLHKETKVLASQYQHLIAAHSQLEPQSVIQQIPVHQKFLLDYWPAVVSVSVQVLHLYLRVATAHQTTLAADHHQQQVAAQAPVALPPPAQNYHCPP